METIQMVPISKFAKVIGGYAFKSKDFVKQGIAVIKIKNIGDKKLSFGDTDFLPNDFFEISDKYKVRYGDVLISLTGSHITQPNSAVGRVARSYSEQIFLLNQRVGKMKVDPVKCDLGYLYYYMTSPIFRDQVGLRSRGAANQANVSGGDIEGIKIPDYSLPSQQKIAHILSAYDDLIENNLKRIKLLEEMAQITYEQWFVRMKFPGHETTPIDAETGLPEGWEFKNINDLFAIKYGKNLAQTEIKDHGNFPVYGAAGVMGYYDESNVKQKSALITSRGNGSAEVHRTYEEAFVTNNSFVVSTKVDFSYLHLSFTIELLKTVGLKNYCSGAAQPQLTNDALKNLYIRLPCQNLIKLFNILSDPLIELADTLRLKNRLLKEARDILLPRLMTGMINVDHIELPIKVKGTEAA